MKKVYFSLIVFFLVLKPVFSEENIYVTGTFQDISLVGLDGDNGRSAIGCEDGEAGEDGFPGEDVNIFFREYKDLKSIRMDLSGGIGGTGGRAPMFTSNCSQAIYERGRDGLNGRYGNITLYKNLASIPKEVKFKSISLRDAIKNQFDFVRNKYVFKKGASKLFEEKSQISNYYKEFHSQKKLKVRTESDLSNVDHYVLNYLYTKNGLSLRAENALLEYTILKSEEEALVRIDTLYPRTIFKNIEYLDVEGSKGKTKLILNDDSHKDPAIKTTYSLFLFKYSSFLNRYIMLGDFGINDQMVTFDDKYTYLEIGKHKNLEKELSEGNQFKMQLNVFKSLKSNPTSRIHITLKNEFRIED